MSNDAEALYTSMLTHALSLYVQDRCFDEIKEDLQEKGLTEELAEKIAQQAGSLYEEAVNKKANKNMLYGSLWFFGGLMVTIITYTSGSDRYIIAYGAIIGGLIQLVSGLIQKSKI